MEDADGVAAATDAGNDHIRQPSWAAFRGVLHLAVGLKADDRLEIPHHCRIGMGTKRAAQQVVGRFDVGYPIANSFVNGVFERLRTAVDRPHLGAKQLHTEDIWLLSLHVDRPHIDDAFDAQQRGRGGCGDAVLAGARFSHDARLAHLALHQQRLAQGIVDFMGAGVSKIFPLQIDLGAAQLFAQAAGIANRGRTADVGMLQVGQFRHELFIPAGVKVRFFQFVQRRHQRLRHIFAAVWTETPGFVRYGAEVDRW